MAGHSKWANTKHRKKAQDIKKSKIFTKIIREITKSSIKNGSNINTNSHLKTLLEKANSYNIKKDLINKALKRNLINNKKNAFHEMKYAGYGPGGTAIIIYCNTNNSNRTVNKIRNVFSYFNGNLVKYKNIKYLFNFFYVIKINTNIYDEQIILNTIYQKNKIHSKKIKKKYLEVVVKKHRLKAVKECLISANIAFKEKNAIVKPKIIYDINSTDKEKIINLINLLKKIPDTTEIFYNANI